MKSFTIHYQFPHIATLSTNSPSIDRPLYVVAFEGHSEISISLDTYAL